MIRNEIKVGAALLLLRKVTHEEQQCREKKLSSGIKWGKTLSLYPREKVKQNKRNSGRSGKKKESPP